MNRITLNPLKRETFRFEPDNVLKTKELFIYSMQAN